MNSIELIKLQIEKGNKILDDVSKMRERHTNVINMVAFVSEDVQNNRKAINAWQYLTQDVLLSIYSKDDYHINHFKDTITDKNVGFNYQREFTTEINNGLSVLESAYESLKLGLTNSNTVNCSSSKPPKIFISHKTEDKSFVNELVKLIEFVIGSDPDKIFCSSIGGYDIKPGDEILSELKRQFNDYEVLFLVVHSPRYYKSPVCLNEMGASWVLGTKFISFLTPDCEYPMLKGVIDDKYMSIKVNDAQDTVSSKLNSFKDYLLDIFSCDKEKFNQTRWETLRNDFVAITSSMKCDARQDEKDNNEASSKKNADIQAELISKNPYVISVINRGKGVAKNVNIMLDKECEGMLVSGLDHFPMEFLKPQHHINLNLYPCIGDPQKFKIYFTWYEKDVKFESEDVITI